MGTSYNSSIVTDGLVLCLDAANPRSYPGSGTSWGDLSGNSNNGTLTNGLAFVSNGGKGISFDDTNESITVSHDSSLNVSSHFSVCLWTYPKTKNSTYRTAIIKGDRVGLASSNKSWAIRQTRSISNDNRVIAQVATSNGDYTASWTPPSPTESFDNSWHYYCLVYDQSNLYLYIDNYLKASITATGNLINHSRNITIGRGDPLDTTEYWYGYMGIVKLYHKALSADEVRRNYNATRGRYGN